MKNKKFDEVLFVKLPKEMKEKLHKKATKKYKNVSEYVRDLIVEDLNEG